MLRSRISSRINLSQQEKGRYTDGKVKIIQHSTAPVALAAGFAKAVTLDVSSRMGNACGPQERSHGSTRTDRWD